MDNKIRHTYQMRQDLNLQCDAFFEYVYNRLWSKIEIIDTILLVDANNRNSDNEWLGLS